MTALARPCQHQDIKQRMKTQVPQFVCGDCKQKLLVVPTGWTIMTKEEFLARQGAAKRRQTTGLVTPEEHRREQQGRKG